MFQKQEKKTQLEETRDKFAAAAKGGYLLHLKTPYMDGAYYVVRVGAYRARVLYKLPVIVSYVDVSEVWPIKDSVAVNKMLDYMLYGEEVSSVA